MDGLSTPYRLTIRNSARLFHIVLFNMEDLHLGLTPLNLSTLNAGILIMMQQVRLMMISLNMVGYSVSFFLLSTWDFFSWTSRGDHSEPFLLFEFCCGTPPSCLKVRVGGGGLQHFSVSPRPLGFWFLVLGVWGQGLTICGIKVNFLSKDKKTLDFCLKMQKKQRFKDAYPPW